MKFTMARSITAFGLLFVLGFGATIAVNHYTLSKLEVGGSEYGKIVDGKDLIADILPPPMYLVEAILMLHDLEIDHVLDDPQRLASAPVELGRLKREFEARVSHWRASALPEELLQKVDDVSATGAGFWDIVDTEFLPALSTRDVVAAEKSFDRVSRQFLVHKEAVLALVNAAQAHLSGVEAKAIELIGTASWFNLIVELLVFALVLGMVLVFRTRMIGALIGLAGYMKKLADDDLEAEVPHTGRSDEIGDMARSVSVFKSVRVERRRLAAEAEETQRVVSAERDQRAAEDMRNRQEAERAVAIIGAGLGRLSDGDLMQRLDIELYPEADQLRHSFNASVQKLENTLVSIVRAAGSIWTGMNEFSSAADDLSRRTEQQAASLEQTVASIGQITDTVRRTAEGASSARQLIGNALGDAEASEKTAESAIEAMSLIEQSSTSIAGIIGVVDEIAFQTNLLALNAGVEAARAGEAGRGFAVVASEVRELAQRSAEAAKQIKVLIEASTRHVETGVNVVSETRQGLRRISERVSEASSVINGIAQDATDEATSLREINAAISQMDQTTQQNAAMVEQSTAASHAITRETEQLLDLVRQFQVGKADAETPAQFQRQSHSRPRLVARSGQGSAALRLRPAEDNESWTEF